MQPQNGKQELLRKYLLGELDEGRQVQVEERLLSDKDFNEQLSKEQDHLIDDYVFDALSETERESFERHFLPTAERLGKFHFAQAIRNRLEKETVSEAAATANWWQRLSSFLVPYRLKVGLPLTALLLSVMVYVSWRAIEMWNLRWQQSYSQKQRANMEQEIAKLNRPPHVPEHSTSSQELSLKPSIFRGAGEMRRAVVNDSATILLLKLELTGGRFQSYQARLLTDENVEVFVIGDLKAENEGADGLLILRIPAKFLPTGDYRIKLSGTAPDGQATDVGDYAFQVVNRAASG